MQYVRVGAIWLPGKANELENQYQRSGVRLPHQGIHRCARPLLWLFALLFNVLACTATAYAAEVRYDYDALGRLIRVIDEQGRVTEYVYDPAGNILQVTGAGAGGAQAPVITSITPVTLRQGRSYAVQVSGSNLLGVRVTTPDPALDNSNLIVSATSVTFTLTIGATAAVGNHVLTFTNAAGSTQSTITVVTAITYTYVMIPSPLALPPTMYPVSSR